VANERKGVTALLLPISVVVVLLLPATVCDACVISSDGRGCDSIRYRTSLLSGADAFPHYQASAR